MTTTLHTRWAVRRDLPEVLAISDASFAGGWTEDAFLQALARRNCISMVCEDAAGRVVGYVVYTLHADRTEVENLAVAPDARRRGVGSALVARLAYKVVTHRRAKFVARVPEDAYAALCLFRASGALAVGFERGAGGEPGAVIMEYRPTADEYARHGYSPPPVNRVAEYL